jgi:hypothetical protein
MLTEKIIELEKKHHEYIRRGKANEYHCKLEYLLAKQNGTLSMFKAKEIAKRIAKNYTLDMQIDIILNGNDADIAILKAYRTQAANEVEELILKLEAEELNGTI